MRKQDLNSRNLKANSSEWNGLKVVVVLLWCSKGPELNHLTGTVLSLFFFPPLFRSSFITSPVLNSIIIFFCKIFLALEQHAASWTSLYLDQKFKWPNRYTVLLSGDRLSLQGHWYQSHALPNHLAGQKWTRSVRSAKNAHNEWKITEWA